MDSAEIDELTEGTDIAVIGMAGRFPRANNIDEFWRNLRDGVNSIKIFTDEEMKSLGVDPAALSHPNFVKAGALMEGADLFDAEFFGYSPTEARILDPQHRVFLECAWEALENAGYDPENCGLLIGVYAGTSLSSYLLFNLLNAPAYSSPEDSFQLMIGNDKDFLSTRAAYELNLKGPAIDIQTGCSTSLVALHLACQGLLSYQCDMALSGGVSAQVPQRTGYYYQQGGINSPDGYCRAFDAKAQGTIFGSGVGIVVLKRLQDAMRDGDSICAVIKGSAINNDGASKIGYTAPCIEGQAQVIAMAQAVAGIEADTISYVETHGTGTELGDPVEVAALIKAFGPAGDKNARCAIGSVKASIGHLDAAAGVAGFIKTVLALKHKLLPPSINFDEPNPRIDFENSPFYVNTKLSEWPAGPSPRRAGVSSFGIGGTNAHVIVEESPTAKTSDSRRRWQLLTLSARTSSALTQSTFNLAQHLNNNPDINLGDVAYTLQVGRKPFSHRRMLVCSDPVDAAVTLEQMKPERVFTAFQEEEDRQIIFLFPGGGAQYPGMGLDLYRLEPVFREQVDLCCDLLKPQLGCDLRDLLFPSIERRDEAALRLKETTWALPALFAIEYSLARLWISWGIRPHAMIGHSLGEYAAACLSDVFTLEQALSLVVLRGRLFERLPAGSMLSVALSEQELRSLMNDRLSIAAINGPLQSVVSGSAQATEEMAVLLDREGIDYSRIHIGVAAHSQMVDLIKDDFARAVSKLQLDAPAIPFISNVTGTWITNAEATDPQYWASHLRQTVRFGDGIQELLKEPNRILLEVGPGQTLSTLARPQINKDRGHVALSSMRHPLEKHPDDAVLVTTLGKLWLSGARFDWKEFYRDERRQRIPLPTYPFERSRFWVEPQQTSLGINRHSLEKKSDISEWFYVPTWVRVPAHGTAESEPSNRQQRTWLAFEDDCGLGQALVSRIQQVGEQVVSVRMGERFQRIDEKAYLIDPRSRRNYEQLFEEICGEGMTPQHILHLWSITPEDFISSGAESFRQLQDAGFYSLLRVAQAFAAQKVEAITNLWCISNRMHDVETGNLSFPEKATMLGACKVIPQEMESLACRCIDLRMVEPGTRQQRHLIDQLLAEFNASPADTMIAFRGNQRWVQQYEQMHLESVVEGNSILREQGVYLITGGLGGVGLLLAEYLARSVRAKLILTARSRFPDQAEWSRWLSIHGETDDISRKLHRLQAMEALGAEVHVFNADASDEQEMASVLDWTINEFGALHGVLHTAGLAGEKAIKLISEIDVAECENNFQAKVYGCYALEKILSGRALDFCLLISSNAAVLGGLGSAAYSAANLFMDSFSYKCDKAGLTHWVSANWDGWLLEDESRISASYQTSLDRYAMTATESVEAFRRVVSQRTLNQIAVSTGDLRARINLYVKGGGDGKDDASRGASSALHQRPALGTDYVACSNDLESKVAQVWQEILGIEQVGVHDNFFDLGGNSLMGIKLITRLKRELNVDIPVTALFEGPTVKALAKFLAGEAKQTPAYDESQSRGKNRREKRMQKQRAAQNVLRSSG